MEKAIGLYVHDILAIQPEYLSRYDDGILGLSPHEFSQKYKENNFMRQLLQFEAIGNNIFSIFPNYKPGESTHIKFGGWD